MRVLWLCNVVIPLISEKLDLPNVNSGGWMVSLADDLLHNTDIRLGFCAPIFNKKFATEHLTLNEIKFYGIYMETGNSVYYDSSIEKVFEEILHDFKPDLVHIFGTEYPHTLALTKVCRGKYPVIINIQGLCSVYLHHFDLGIPIRYQYFYTLRDFLRQDNINQQRKKFKRRGQYEVQAISQINHVIGRTDWDKACSLQINPNVHYHTCNESLRDSFYQARWGLGNCRKHSIFISQSYYPIKGFHLFLEALPNIIQQFSDVHVFTTGKDYIHTNSPKDLLRMSAYQLLIRNIIKRYQLAPYITFLGELDEAQICQAYLDAHVFVSPSTIENSPNSLGEAMLLGVPCVSSYVGGVSNMLIHGKEGFLYPADEPYMISYYVCKLFSSDELAERFSEAAHLHALETHDRRKNLQQLLKIYEEVVNE